MPENEKAAGLAGRGGGATSAAARPSLSKSNDTISRLGRQAPPGWIAPVLKGDLIYIAGRHVCSTRGGVLRRTFDASRELLRDGLSFRRDVLELAIRAGAMEIIATERQTGQRYRTTIEHLLTRGWEYKSRDFGSQIVLDLREWERVGKADPVQLALWGVRL